MCNRMPWLKCEPRPTVFETWADRSSRQSCNFKGVSIFGQKPHVGPPFSHLLARSRGGLFSVTKHIRTQVSSTVYWKPGLLLFYVLHTEAKCYPGNVIFWVWFGENYSAECFASFRWHIAFLKVHLNFSTVSCAVRPGLRLTQEHRGWGPDAPGQNLLAAWALFS